VRKDHLCGTIGFRLIDYNTMLQMIYIQYLGVWRKRGPETLSK